MISVRTHRSAAASMGDEARQSAHLPRATRDVLREVCEPGADVQLVITAGALRTAPRFLSALLPALWRGCAARGRGVGRPIVVHGPTAVLDAEISRLPAAKTVLVLAEDTAARATRTPLSAYVVRPHADTSATVIRVRTDGDPELVALRLLTTISTLSAARPEDTSV